MPRTFRTKLFLAASLSALIALAIAAIALVAGPDRGASLRHAGPVLGAIGLAFVAALGIAWFFSAHINERVRAVMALSRRYRSSATTS
jgi:hypothetical protein